MPELTVRKLIPALLQTYLHYFDHAGFSDNADYWAACYCLYYHFQHDTAKWAERTAEQNRSTISDLINNDQYHGYLAYVDNQIAGWCQAAPRIELYALKLQAELKVDDAEQVGSIVCFNVSPDRRGQGIATALLTAACTGFKEIGLRVAEGYPRLKTESITSNYKGPLKMYLDAGFTKFREFEHSMMVRRAL